MNKHDKRIGVESNEFWEIEEGMSYVIQEIYCADGEQNVILMDENGNQYDLPEAIVESYTKNVGVS